MKFLIVVALLAASVAGTLDIDRSEVIPRHFDTRLPLVPYGRLPAEERITNGQAATAKQFPYQVGMTLVYPEGNYWCGGTLISSSWILTAAHCTLGVALIEVILGGLRSTPNGDTGELVVYVEGTAENVIVHKDYDDWTLANDVSLVRLPSPVSFTDYIQPASLPRFTGIAPVYTGETGIASGWGLVSDSSTSISPTLQWADMQVITNAACAVYYGRLETSMMCVGTESRKSICSGDSGGPLVLEGTNILFGVTSFGAIYGCEYGWPAGFSRVTSFLGWIAEHSGVTP